MRRHLVMAALLALCTAPAGAAEQPPAVLAPSPHAIDIPPWFKESFLDLGADVREAAARKKRLMLYFGQDGCPYCKQLMQVNFSQKDIVEKTRAGFDAIALNIWGDRETVWVDGQHRTEKQLAQHLKVHFTPTLLFFDEQGKVVLRLNGYYPPHKFRAALDWVGGRMENKVAFTDYLPKASGVPASGLLHDEPFFRKPPYDLTKRSKGKPLAVFFEQKECAPCDEMHASALKDPETLKLMAGFDVVRLDLHGTVAVITPQKQKSTEAQWAKALGVAYAPGIVFFDEGGREVFRVEAYLKAFHLQSALDFVATRGYEKYDNFQRFIQARADAMRERGQAVDIWK